MKRLILTTSHIVVATVYFGTTTVWTSSRNPGAIEHPLRPPQERATGSLLVASRPASPTRNGPSSDPWIYLPGLSLTPLGGTQIGFSGLRVPPGFQNGATGMITLPSDWDGVSDFTVSLYFSPWTNDTGVVGFFIRPVGRQPGQSLEFDPGSISSPGIDVPANSPRVLFVQSFTVSGRVSPSDSVFHLYTIQRGGLDETFPGDVILHGVQIAYN